MGDRCGPPTIRQLAADLGLDISTVSRGLKGSPRVAAATQESIRQRANAIGYRPDPTLARLAHHRWAGKQQPRPLSIALLTPRKQGVDSGYVSLMPAAAERMGYSLRQVAISDFPDTEALQDYLFHGGMRGILFGHSAGMLALPALGWDAFAVTECGSVAFQHPFDAVQVDTFEQMRIALLHMLRAGHRRIAVVQHPSVLDSDHRRRAAMNVVATSHGLKKLPVFEVAFRPAADVPAQFAAWCRRYRPRALVFPSAHIARLLLAALPAPLPCAALMERGDVRGFAHVRVDLPRVGRRAVEELCRSLSYGRFGIPAFAERILVRPQWVPGASLDE